MMRPDARSALIHYMRSLAMPEAVCGNFHAATITLDAAQVTCARCRKKLPLAAFPEKELLARVRYIARQAGFKTYHTHDSRKSEAGFPDLVMIKAKTGEREGFRGRLIFAELKKEGETPTIEQQAWLDALATVPDAETYLWRPSDMPHIIDILTQR